MNVSSTALFRSACAAVLSLACAASQAVVIVDTGVPTGSTAISLFNSGGTSVSYLGGSFTIGSGQTINQVEGWISTSTAGNITLGLWAGAPDVSQQPLFSTTRSFAVAASAWQAFSGFSWAIGPGTYTVTFSPATGYNGSMQSGPPAPLPKYYGYYPPGFGPNWILTGNTYGIRVSAVPELATSVLMLAGLGLLGRRVAARRLRSSVRPAQPAAIPL